MLKKIRSAVSEAIRRIDEHTAISIATAKLHEKTFLPYKNYCQGIKDVVVCGAGPSLQDYQPIEGAVHIAVNRAFLYNKVNFDFIFAQDMDGIRMVQDELIAYRPGTCVKFLALTTAMNSKTIPESLALKCNALRFNCDLYIYRDGYKSKMVFDIESRALGGMPNVGMSVMQLALYMNPRKIYIVGCDMSGTHFTNKNMSNAEQERERKELERMWKNEYDKQLEKWAEIKAFAETYYPNTQIISVNPVGLKGMFTDLYQET